MFVAQAEQRLFREEGGRDCSQALCAVRTPTDAIGIALKDVDLDVDER